MSAKQSTRDWRKTTKDWKFCRRTQQPTGLKIPQRGHLSTLFSPFGFPMQETHLVWTQHFWQPWCDTYWTANRNVRWLAILLICLRSIITNAIDKDKLLHKRAKRDKLIWEIKCLHLPSEIQREEWIWSRVVIVLCLCCYWFCAVSLNDNLVPFTCIVLRTTSLKTLSKDAKTASLLFFLSTPDLPPFSWWCCVVGCRARHMTWLISI